MVSVSVQDESDDRPQNNLSDDMERPKSSRCTAFVGPRVIRPLCEIVAQATRAAQDAETSQSSRASRAIQSTQAAHASQAAEDNGAAVDAKSARTAKNSLAAQTVRAAETAQSAQAFQAIRSAQATQAAEDIWAAAAAVDFKSAKAAQVSEASQPAQAVQSSRSIPTAQSAAHGTNAKRCASTADVRVLVDRGRVAPKRRPESAPLLVSRLERRTPSGSGCSSCDLALGSPVTFYLEGRPAQRFGRVRQCHADGAYTVDVMPHGGRLVRLGAVTPCAEADLPRQRRPMRFGSARGSKGARDGQSTSLPMLVGSASTSTVANRGVGTLRGVVITECRSLPMRLRTRPFGVGPLDLASCHARRELSSALSARPYLGSG